MRIHLASALLIKSFQLSQLIRDDSGSGGGGGGSGKRSQVRLPFRRRAPLLAHSSLFIQRIYFHSRFR